MPNVLAPPGERLWLPGRLPTWAELTLAPQPTVVERPVRLAGSAALPNGHATDWLRLVVHRRERGRGTSQPVMPDQIFEAICLAWAGEHDAALARVLALVQSVRNADWIRVIVARVAMAAALAIRRPGEAVQALNTWWELSPSAEARQWARLVAAIAPTHISSIRPIHEPGPSDGATSGWDAGPWLDRILDATWHAAAADSEAIARQGLAIAAGRHAPASAEDMVGLWRLWRGTALPLTELVSAWPEVDRPGLRLLLEQGRHIEPPAVWDQLARAYCEVHGPTEQIVRNAGELADLLSIDSVIYWETVRQNFRMRAESPLLQRTKSEQIAAVDAVFSGSIAVAAGLGSAAVAALARAAGRLTPADVRRTVILVRDAAPKALPQLLQALETGPLDPGSIAESISGLGLDSAALRREG